jgi:hypothetical protein
MNFALNVVSVPGGYNGYDAGFDLWRTYILKYCSHVQLFEITFGVDDILLQRIFENILNLKTLLLHSCENCTNFRFIGQDSTRDGGFSIKRLKFLEHLEIRHFGADDGIDIMKISREFHFPC